MSAADHPLIGIDATPLATGHAIRGIGRYLGGIVRAAAEIQPDWMSTNVGLLLLQRQPVPIAAAAWRTWRSPVRPQDVDPFVSGIVDRFAIHASRPRTWHHTDPANPATPLPTARTLVTVYDLIPLRDAAVLAHIRPHRRLHYRRYLDLVRECAGVVAISESTAADVVELLGVSRDRIRVVPPWIAPTDPGAAAAASTLAGSRVSYLFVGIPESHKRPELAIDAFAELIRRGVDADLSFAGVHPAGLRTELRRRVASAGVESRVEYLDRIDDAELGRRYARSILVATSSIEGFGLPLVEAILAGGRVAATPTTAYREAVGAAAAFSVDASTRALADAMETAIDRAPTAADRSALAERFGSAAVAGALLDAYTALTGS